MTHTDIQQSGWISRLPSRLRAYVQLARLDRPVGIWLLLLPGWWAIALAGGGIVSLNRYDLKLWALFGVGAVVMRAAGCIINDLWDRRLDAQVERTQSRPLAAGTISPRGAMVFLVLLLCAGLAILLQIPSLVTVLTGFLAIPLIVLYPLMKRITWWPQLFLGVIFNFGVLMGWSAVTGVIGLSCLTLYAAGIFWTLGYDTIYAHQDKEDDMRVGIKSTALRLGAQSRIWVAGFYVSAWVLMVLAFQSAAAGWPSLLLLLPVGAHFIWQVRRWEPDNPQNSLAVFRSNRDLGLIVLAAALA
ncbi:MAG TPA: 4-hydroxybenzoate octaprenyltransferase [Alphaproteobacteria bacterium]